ncbi:MAG TPA: S9 family peptidase [Terracidiphilus sp.]|nr:S9 family peptidase [Terracidiphilus sp.]
MKLTRSVAPAFCAAALFFAPVAVLAAPADQAAQSALSAQLDAIFNKHEYEAKSVQLAWQEDGAIYTILEPAASGKGMDIVAYATATGQRTVLIPARRLTPAGASAPLTIQGYSWSGDRKKLLIYTNGKKVWRLPTRGDYWVYEEGAGKLTKLGGDAPESSLMFATFSPDGAKVAWVREHNLYVEDLGTEKITQLTSDGSADIINGTSDWVNEEELELRNCFRWSPDSQSIAYWQFDQSGVGEYTLINDTEGEYPVLFKYKYPQPGTTNSAVRVGVVAAAGGPTKWVALEGDPRQHYIAQMEWAGNSKELMIEYLDRLQQHDQLMLADAATGQAKLFFEDSDKAWVNAQPLKWITAGAGISKTHGPEPDLLWVSERDGWRHAYRVDRGTGEAKLITSFAADIMGVEAIDDAGGWIYFLASPDDATRMYLYRSRLDGSGTPERVTPANEPGWHGYNIAPDAKYAVHVMSTFSTPNRIEVVSLPDHKVLRTLVSNDELAAKVKALVQEPEFFKVPVANGVTLDGWMVKPPGFDPNKKYPVLTYVYGEPAGAMVRDEWQGSRGLFHAAIAAQGYIILCFDNEGTPAPKGREWRKVVYGAVGVLSSAQQSEAIQALAREHSYIDATRMAIWGWSGGGSNTLNMMLRYPGVYGTGIAVAPVADESHYDSIYQERYMGLPQDNKQGYHDGSPINFAAGLAGHLLVVHGSGDDNVHYQGTELLINKFVELGKPFDFMDYPNRTHCICEGRGTTFHVYSLIARYLEDHVPAGGR